MNIELISRTDVKSRSSICRMRQLRCVRRRLERLWAAQALFEPREVYVPRGMYRLWVLLPELVHLVGIVRIGSVGKEVIAGGALCQRRLTADEWGESKTGRSSRSNEPTDDLPGQHG